jgi:hypothetical protein
MYLSEKSVPSPSDKQKLDDLAHRENKFTLSPIAHNAVVGRHRQHPANGKAMTVDGCDNGNYRAKIMRVLLKMAARSTYSEIQADARGVD